MSEVDVTDGCWLWRGSVAGIGYGMLRLRGRRVYAHRLSYELHVAEIPDGDCVCHSCDTPACVRPDHLFAASQAENVRDMMRKGRHKYEAHSGEKNGNAKLSHADIEKIRDRYQNGETNKAKLGRQFGVSGTMIRYIVNRDNWTD